MKHISVEKHIQHIVESAKGNLYFLNNKVGHMPTDQRFPVIIAFAQTSAIIDYEGVDKKAQRVFDVSLLMLEKEPKPEVTDAGKEPSFEYHNRLATRREEMILIFEQIIYYLNRDQFRFRYEIVSDVDYNPIPVEENQFGLWGMQCTFQVASRFTRFHCCIDFDEDKIKTFDKSKY